MIPHRAHAYTAHASGRTHAPSEYFGHPPFHDRSPASGDQRRPGRLMDGRDGFALLDMVLAILILGMVAAFVAESLWSAGRSYAEMRSYRDGFHKAVNCMEKLAVEFEKDGYGDFFDDSICSGCTISRTKASQEESDSFRITSGTPVTKESAAGRLIHVTVRPDSGAPALTRLFGK